MVTSVSNKNWLNFKGQFNKGNTIIRKNELKLIK